MFPAPRARADGGTCTGHFGPFCCCVLLACVLHILRQPGSNAQYKFVRIRSCAWVLSYRVRVDHVCFSKSRAESFVSLGIELPTDDLLRVIISKSFSEKQIEIGPKISEYIIKNIERSYEKVFKFVKEIDDLSLSSGKSININLIKKVLINNE